MGQTPSCSSSSLKKGHYDFLRVRPSLENERIRFRDLQSDYRLLHVVGAGYSGEVRLGLCNLTKQLVAIKSFPLKSINTVKAKLLKNEVLLHLSLDHPAIAKVMSVHVDGNGGHLVTEFCPGKQLRDLLSQGRDPVFLPEADVIRLCRQMFDAVRYLHERKVVHRDLKLENFLCIIEGREDEVGGESGTERARNGSTDAPVDFSEVQVKLIDFGFARLLSGGDSRGDTSADADRLSGCLGTAAYIPPEMLNFRQAHGTPADMWSLGVVVYFLLCGRFPFDGRRKDELFRRIVEDGPCFDGQPWDSVSVVALDFVRGLLEKDPSRRLTAEEAVRHPWLQTPLPESRRSFVLDGEGVGVLSTPTAGGVAESPMAGGPVTPSEGGGRRGGGEETASSALAGRILSHLRRFASLNSLERAVCLLAAQALYFARNDTEAGRSALEAFAAVRGGFSGPATLTFPEFRDAILRLQRESLRERSMKERSPREQERAPPINRRQTLPAKTGAGAGRLERNHTFTRNGQQEDLEGQRQVAEGIGPPTRSLSGGSWFLRWWPQFSLHLLPHHYHQSDPPHAAPQVGLTTDEALTELSEREARSLFVALARHPSESPLLFRNFAVDRRRGKSRSPNAAVKEEGSRPRSSSDFKKMSSDSTVTAASTAPRKIVEKETGGLTQALTRTSTATNGGGGVAGGPASSSAVAVEEKGVACEASDADVGALHARVLSGMVRDECLPPLHECSEDSDSNIVKGQEKAKGQGGGPAIPSMSGGVDMKGPREGRRRGRENSGSSSGDRSFRPGRGNKRWWTMESVDSKDSANGLSSSSEYADRVCEEGEVFFSDFVAALCIGPIFDEGGSTAAEIMSIVFRTILMGRGEYSHQNLKLPASGNTEKEKDLAEHLPRQDSGRRFSRKTTLIATLSTAVSTVHAVPPKTVSPSPQDSLPSSTAARPRGLSGNASPLIEPQQVQVPSPILHKTSDATPAGPQAFTEHPAKAALVFTDIVRVLGVSFRGESVEGRFREIFGPTKAVEGVTLEDFAEAAARTRASLAAKRSASSRAPRRFADLGMQACSRWCGCGLLCGKRRLRDEVELENRRKKLWAAQAQEARRQMSRTLTVSFVSESPVPSVALSICLPLDAPRSSNVRGGA